VIIELIISVAGGAAVGWITNSIAVNMLFKKFLGRWGGVIESNYKELIHNLSGLVERRLINAQTLKNEIEKKPFNDTLQAWVKDVLQNELPEKTENLYVKNIPDINETINQIAGYVKHEITALDGIKLGEILSEDSYRYFIDRNITKLFPEADKYKNIISETLAVFFAGRTFNDLFSEEFIKQIKTNINDIINKIDFSRYDAALDQCFEQIIKSDCVDNVIKNLENHAGGMSIAEITGMSGTPPYTELRAMVGCIADFTESARGKELLFNLINAMINEAELPRIKSYDIIHPQFIKNITIFIERRAPSLIDKLIQFVNNSREEIDGLIDEAAEQHFKREGAANNKVQAFVFGAFSKTMGFTGKIIEILSQNRNSAGEKLSYELNKYLRNTSVGEIVSRLKKANVLNAENIVKIINGKLRNIQFENSETLTKIINTPIKELFPNIDFSFIKIKLFPFISSKLKQLLYNKSEKQNLQRNINGAIDSFATKDIGGLLNINTILAERTVSESAVKDMLFRQWGSVANINAGAFAADKIGGISWENIKEHIKNYRVNGIYGALQKEKIYEKTADAVQNLIVDNLNMILGGSVFDIAKNELSGLSPSQVNHVVQGFMGSQLKPINVIGAILGGFAGILTVLITYLLKIPENFTWPLFAVYGLIFAVVGIGTNWIAIKMLFHPYKRVFGLNFPPFIGVAACKQKEFASGIAKLIQRNMLNKAALQHFYVEKKDALMARCKEIFSAENYKFIDDFFADDARNAVIVDNIFNFLRKYVKKTNKELSEYIDNYILKNIETGGIKNTARQIQDALVQIIKSEHTADYIGRKIQNGINGKTIAGMPLIIDALIDLCCKYLRNTLSVEKITDMLGAYELFFNTYIEKNSISDLAGQETSADFSSRLAGKISLLPQKAAGGIAGILAKKQSGRTECLKNCFGGFVPALIERAGIVKIICKLASSQKKLIVDKIMNGSDGDSFWKQVVKQATSALMRKDVEAITEIVIDQKLFPFLTERRKEVFGIADNILESELGFDCQILSKDTMKAAFSRLFSGGAFIGAAANLSAGFLNQFMSMTLKKTLSIINADTISGFSARLYPLLEASVPEINSCLSDKTLTAKLKQSPVFSAIFSDIPAAATLRNINISSEIRGISLIFFGNEAVLKHINKIIDDMSQKILTDKYFYNHALFRADLSNFMMHCADKNEYAARFESFLDRLFRNANNLIAPGTKNALCGDYLLPALFDACGKQFPGLVNTLSLYTVVESEINMMSPEEIEEMFYSFSGSYFKKIILYGWIGLFGGLLSYLIGCLVSGLV
jgi:uncharacterized membrane protein YheB (UPF0754 family)